MYVNTIFAEIDSKWCGFLMKQRMVDRYMLYYKEFESRPVFETVDEMLKWSGLYELTRRTLEDELVDAGLSPCLISELVTVRYSIVYTVLTDGLSDLDLNYSLSRSMFYELYNSLLHYHETALHNLF